MIFIIIAFTVGFITGPGMLEPCSKENKKELCLNLNKTKEEIKND